jgi:lysophospholipase L1-like esterase
MEHRDLDLLVLGFGGNEADDPLRPIELHYEEEFVRVIRTMRAGRRDMSCLIFAPLDQAARDERGNVTTMRTIPTIVEAQRNAARREGCAFFDTFAAMGGEGSMGRWTRSRPRLALSDYRHATPAGYEVIGNMFYKALLKAFAENL